MRRSITMVSFLAISVFLFAVVSAGSDQKLSGKYDQSYRQGETRPTLDPDLFSEPVVREAYEAARDIPWVLDSIYCYCLCKESPTFRHKSLLSCYVDKHAAV